MSLCKLNKWEIMILESDCLTMVQAIRSKVPMHAPFGDIIMECQRLVHELNIGDNSGCAL